MKLLRYIGLSILCFACVCEAKLPDLTSEDVLAKTKEIMKAHASQKKLTPLLVQRILNNYLDNLDPNRTYFIESDIDTWVHPSDELLNQLVDNYNQGNFKTFEDIQDVLVKAIERRHVLEKTIDYNHLPTQVKPEEFKDIAWAKNETELIDRLRRIRALQIETAAKLNEDMKDKSLQRIAKRQAKYEEEMLNTDSAQHEHLILSNLLKAMASALDAHTAYFTPDEAAQFMINVQQRLFGIGAQLRDDINGFTVVKIVEGGPAALNKDLKVKDRIIAVNGEPVVGMDITDAVDLIRGEENTPVILTVIREVTKEDGTKSEQKLDVTIMRGKVILKETRFKSSYEPYGDGIIGYLRLYSFYQDRDSSSATDLEEEIEKLKKDKRLLGLILDLRSNSGGLLSQAVSVTGLFITKGVVVSIKDENGRVQHLRDLDGSMAWDGPLIVLINRGSASASEIVAQTLQDYGRAIVVGDDHSYGKGSYQTFTLTTGDDDQVNPKGEYKVTRGRYYTVSGKTPQLTGVLSDIVIPGTLSETEMGERFAKYPLENDHIKANFDDDLSDIPFLQRDKIRKLYKFGLQEKLDTYTSYLEKLKDNSQKRVDTSHNYQNFLTEVKKKDDIDLEHMEKFGQNDLQLEEAYSIMKDVLLMMQEKGIPLAPRKETFSLLLPQDL
jgi:carboxyl-terminal processing protease